MATPLTYDLPIVLILFIQATGNEAPSHAEIAQFDADLQSSFDLMLQQILAEEGLPVEQHTKSLVLGCRPFVAGNTSQLQIRNACRYVKAAHQATAAAMALITTGVGAAAPQASSRKPGGARRKGRGRTSARGKRA